MNLNHQILVFVVIIIVSFTAAAEEVYESVDKEGVTEFSDKSSSRAKVIDIEKSNVADSLSEESDNLSASVSVPTTKTEQAPEQLEVIHQGGPHDYVEEDERAREMLEESKVRTDEHRGEVVRQSEHKGGHRK